MTWEGSGPKHLESSLILDPIAEGEKMGMPEEVSEELQAKHPAIRDFPQLAQAFENLGSPRSPTYDRADVQYSGTKMVEPKLKHLMKESRKQLSSEDTDKKRQLRLEKNRQSAALSRQRKKEFIGNLQKQVSKVAHENVTFQQEMNRLTNESWESKLTVQKLEKDILKLVMENNELRGRLKVIGANTDDIKRADMAMGQILEAVAVDMESETTNK